MDVQTIVGVGFALTRGKQPNSYDLKVWVRYHPARPTETASYTGLSYTEAIDVMLTEFDLQRPGWQVLDGTVQPPLWTD